jgi:diacylglycerol kinase family enzyme
LIVPQDKIAILFNPSAGRGKALKYRSRLESLLKEYQVPFDLLATASEENLRALTRECAGLYRTVAGAGGDSTFQIMIEEIVRSGADVDFGLIALGSSNDVAREFDLHSLGEACQALKRRRTRSIDLGAVEHEGEILKYFIGQANMGLGVRVNRYVTEISGKRPRLAACQSLAGTLGIIRSYRRKEVPLSLTVRAGEQKRDGSYLVANFSNIRFWASGKTLNPSARPDDGRLDSCLISQCSFLRLARLAYLARKGGHAGAPEVEFLRAAVYEISSEKAFEVQVDGEIIGGSRTPLLFKDILIRTVPRALRLIC